ncbi:hypothetical protein [Azospirillum largimobile]
MIGWAGLPPLTLRDGNPILPVRVGSRPLTCDVRKNRVRP